VTCPSTSYKETEPFKTRPPCAVLRGAELPSIGAQVQRARRLNAMWPGEVTSPIRGRLVAERLASSGSGAGSLGFLSLHAAALRL
jgi:hypothetical protein